MSIAFQEEREKQIKTLYDFQKPYFFYNWVITNDKEIGGYYSMNTTSNKVNRRE